MRRAADGRGKSANGERGWEGRCRQFRRAGAGPHGPCASTDRVRDESATSYWAPLTVMLTSE
jgi:hypothetical protein